MRSSIEPFIAKLDSSNREAFQSMSSPYQVQAYLDRIPYIGEDLNRSPLMVMQDRQSHCLDGGLLAALALNELGLGARIIDLVPEAGMDDDHVLAIFQINGLFGAVAKSNFSGLRYREPVYRSLRELAMSYFEVFFNIEKIRTLRGYTRPIHLNRFDTYHWQTELMGVERVVKHLYSRPMISLLSPQAVAKLYPLDERSFTSGIIGVNHDGLFKKDQGTH